MRDKIGKEIKVFNKHIGKVIDVYEGFFVVLLNKEGRKKFMGWKSSDEHFYLLINHRDTLYKNRLSFFTENRILKNE